MQIAARNAFTTGGASLPYDAEVEYLESTGTQWIDTGIVGVGGLSIELHFTPVYPTVTSYQDYFGASDGDNVKGYRCRNYGTTEWRAAINAGGMADYSVPLIDSVNKLSFSQGAVSVNGVIYFSAGSSYTTYSLYLFAFNNGGSVYRKSAMRLHLFNVAGQIDLVPVRFTNEQGVSEGAMYDRVSGQLFRNQGTGAFVIGPDK